MAKIKTREVENKLSSGNLSGNAKTFKWQISYHWKAEAQLSACNYHI